MRNVRREGRWRGCGSAHHWQGRREGPCPARGLGFLRRCERVVRRRPVAIDRPVPAAHVPAVNRRSWRLRKTCWGATERWAQRAALCTRGTCWAEGWLHQRSEHALAGALDKGPEQQPLRGEGQLSLQPCVHHSMSQQHKPQHSHGPLRAAPHRMATWCDGATLRWMAGAHRAQPLPPAPP